MDFPVSQFSVSPIVLVTLLTSSVFSRIPPPPGSVYTVFHSLKIFQAKIAAFIIARKLRDKTRVAPSVGENRVSSPWNWK
jgi:hypothetical protein